MGLVAGVFLIAFAIRFWIAPVSVHKKAKQFPTIQIPRITRKQSDFSQAYIDFLLSLRSELSAGLPTTMALQNVSMLLPEEFRQMARDLSNKDLNQWPAEHNSKISEKTRNFAKLSAVIQMSERTGAPLIPSIDAIAQSAMNQQEHFQLVQAELASTKATVAVLISLPAMGILLGFIMGFNVVAWLFRNPLGWFCLITGFLLEASGVMWIRALITRETVIK